MTGLHAPLWAWAAIIAALAAFVGADLVISGRRRRPVGLAEAALWTATTIALAVAFGALIGASGRGAAAGQFFAGWLTEYSLSLDNLLVFVLLITGSRVARRYQGRVLLLGILFALLLRGVLIGIGGVALHQFGWAEYVFGGFLILAAGRMAIRRGDTPAGTGPGGLARAAQVIVPVAPEGEGGRLTILRDGRRYATPLLLLAVAIGVTDLLFALDSIPAIYGLTRDPFLVFSANVFALLGLRHLYFLVGGLLERLVHLPVGLAVVLAFIGVKLIGEALRGYGVDHLGPVPVPEVSAVVSLAVITGVLAITAAASLVTTRRRAAAGEAEAARPTGRAGLVKAPRARRGGGAGRPRPRS
ncbi:MAG TPA: TerC/Alx family metal homeostasis membrane protein [Streptosporangiaceae bacterium]